MTLKDIEQIPREYLIPAEIGACLGIDPQDFRTRVWDDQKKNRNSFDFPVFISKRRIKVPKSAFLKYMRGEERPQKKS